jgi:hypothetical protein
MRFSRTQLSLKYANRNPYIGGALLLLVIGAVFAVFSLPALVRDLRLALAGQTAPGVVRSKSMVRVVGGQAAAGLFAHGGGRRGPSWYLHYEFTVAGQLFGGTVEVPRGQWEAAQVGQPVEVVYLPADPALNRGGPPLWQTEQFTPTAIGLAAWTGALCCLIGGIRSIRCKVQLIAEGSPALGLIDHVEIGQGRKGRRFIRFLRYSFLIDEGGTRSVRHAELRPSVLYHPGEVSPGDLVLVVYDPSNPACHEIDRFDARQDDRLRLLATV